MSDIAKAVMSYIEFMRSDDFHEDQMDKYENKIFEAAVEDVMGKEIWDEIDDILTR